MTLLSALALIVPDLRDTQLRISDRFFSSYEPNRK